MSDNCDHNFGTFDDFSVKNDQKVSNNMILMSKYKGKHGGKKGKKIRAGVSPPPFRAMPERKHFFYRRASLRDATASKNTSLIFYEDQWTTHSSRPLFLFSGSTIAPH